MKTHRLLYIANMRLPTEKAHGLQIVQNCEAFADAGANVTLWTARRVNTPEMRAVDDVWAYYGVRQNFRLGRIPCLDLLPLVPGRTDALGRAAFYLQLLTFVLVALLMASLARVDVVYSRDALVLLALSLVKRRDVLVWECHRFSTGGVGARLQRLTLRRVGRVVAITPTLRDDLIKAGADADRVMVAHDGVRRARFEGVPSQAAARSELAWSADASVVGYVGRFHTLTMDKGLSLLIDAIAALPRRDVTLALIGGPEDTAEELRTYWHSLGLDAARFDYAGHVPPERVPLYLSAFDICAMPHPETTQFAYYTSPIKLFEYMASRRAIVASDLPGWADVVTDDENALLVPPGDVDALADALARLFDNPDLRKRLADAAYERVMAHYTWDARARTILRFLSDDGG